MKLLNEIVDLLMNESGSLNEALLKTKVLLHRIGQRELASWVNDEINGYTDNKEVPPYRHVDVRVMGNITNNRFRYSNYALPVMHLEPAMREFLMDSSMSQALSVLETYVGDGQNSLKRPIAPEMLHELNKGIIGYSIVDAWSEVQQSQVRQILVEVRNRLLDFILALQDEIGDTMTEDDAKKATAGLDVAGMFHGAVMGDNITILVGNHNNQNVNNTNVKHDKAALAEELRKHNVAEEDIELLDAAISQDPQPTNRDQYGPAVQGWMKRMLGKAIDTTWNIKVGAAGSLLATAIQKYYGL